MLEKLRVGKQNADWTACAFFWRQAQISSSTASRGEKYVQMTPIRQRCLMFMNPALLLKSYYRVPGGNNGARANSSVQTGCQKNEYEP